MKNPPLVKGTLIKRYQRFLANVKMPNGKNITAAVPNTGRMITCSEPGSTIYMSIDNNPNRKFQYTWELTKTKTSLVGVNTNVPNKIVYRALKKGQIPELEGYREIRKEVKYGENSRVDLLLLKGKEQCYVEVKNVTLVENGVARFPDAVTTRGLRHLHELTAMVEAGHRAAMFYFVQREDATLFKPADDIDPEYSQALREAHAKGVEIIVYDARVSVEEILLGKPLPFEL